MRHLKLRILAPIFTVLAALTMLIATPASAITVDAPTPIPGSSTFYLTGGANVNYAANYTLISQFTISAAHTITKLGYLRTGPNDGEAVTLHIWTPTSGLVTPAASVTLTGTTTRGVQWGTVSVALAAGTTFYIGVEQPSGYTDNTLQGAGAGSTYGDLTFNGSLYKAGLNPDISTGTASGGTYTYDVYCEYS